MRRNGFEVEPTYDSKYVCRGYSVGEKLYDLDRIARQHGTHIIDHAERIGLGSRSYTLIDLADLTGIQLISSQAMPQSYNIFRIDGTPVGTNMKSLDALSEGLYIINGKKVAIK